MVQVAKKISKHASDKLKLKIEESSSDYDKEKLQERVAKLAGGVAVIKVGATTEIEMKEKKDRVEDAQHATAAAVEEGVLPGGGTAYIRCIEVIETLSKDLPGDQKTGAMIVASALSAPLKQIAENAGKNSYLIMEKIEQEDFTFGYNASEDIYGNMYELGIVDPAKVSRSALQNATSISSMILTTECISC